MCISHVERTTNKGENNCKSARPVADDRKRQYIALRCRKIVLWPTVGDTRRSWALREYDTSARLLRVRGCQ